MRRYREIVGIREQLRVRLLAKLHQICSLASMRPISIWI